MSTLKVNSIEPANAGSEDYFLARVWANFNSIGTVSLRGSGNVSSLTDLAVGRYSLGLSSSLADANYSVQTSWKNDSGTAPSDQEFDQCCWVYGQTSSTILVFSGYRSDVGKGYTDNEFQYVEATR